MYPYQNKEFNLYKPAISGLVRVQKNRRNGYEKENGRTVGGEKT